MDASLEVAERFVDATLKDLRAQDKLDHLDEELPLQLKNLRHVRIMYADETGNLTIVSPNIPVDSTAKPYVPAWYAALVRPSVADRSIRVMAGDGRPIVILGEPADEIAEAWQDFSSLAIVWLGINALVLAILYVVLGRVLDPLANLSKGMLRLEDGHYATRLKPSKMKELALITDRLQQARERARHCTGRE